MLFLLTLLGSIFFGWKGFSFFLVLWAILKTNPECFFYQEWKRRMKKRILFHPDFHARRIKEREAVKLGAGNEISCDVCGEGGSDGCVYLAEEFVLCQECFDARCGKLVVQKNLSVKRRVKEGVAWPK